jgi:hypothetical protein
VAAQSPAPVPGTPRPSRSGAPTSPSTASPAPTSPACRAGSATLAATADAYVDQALPDRSYGAAANLLVTSRGRERNRRALVRFALPAIPSGCTLSSATFTLTAKQASGRRLVVARAASAWTESVTWNTAPAVTGASIGATVTGTTVSWTVTSLVSAMRSAGTYGFVIRDASEDARGVGAQTDFAARTAGSGPVLTVRWS